MAYFPDLSPYTYLRAEKANPSLLNVGWLDLEYPYTKGPIEEGLIKKLLILCKTPVNRTRGWHNCPFCREYPVRVSTDGTELCLGDAEIRVKGESGISYASPTLIYHYVRDHGYRPPQQFLDALAKT